jgi:PAS domain S-box-containing protein
LKEDEGATSSGRLGLISRARKRVAAIFISCLGLALAGPYLISELLEADSPTDLLQHLTRPSLIFHHIMVFLAIPTFMIIGYFYQKQKNLAENLREKASRLHESRTRLKNVFAASPDAITVTDLNGNIIECNQAALEVLGCSSKEELIGKSGFEFIAKKDHQRAMENMKKILEQGSVRNVEYTCLTKDGREFPAELSASVIRDSSGNPIGVVAITKDITERRKAEEKLRFLKEFNERVINSLGDALLVIDPNDYTIISANEAALKQLKMREEDLIGKTCYETTHHRSTPCKPPHDVCPIQEMLKTGETVTLEHTHFDKDNNEIYVEVSASPVRNQQGNIVQIVHLTRDITERRKAEKEIRKVQERFSGIYNSSKDAIGFASLDGILLDVNDAFCKLTGYSREELLTRKKYQDITPKEYHEYEAKIIEGILRTGKPAEYEKEYIRKDGSRVPILLTTFVVKGDDGKPIGLAAIIKDITERKQKEEALRRSEERARRLLEFQNKVIDTAVVWINLLDVEGNVTLWNRAAELISGYSREEVIGHKKIWEWLYPDPKYRAKIFAQAKKIIEKGERVENYETTIRCKDGTLKTISWYSNNILDEKGKLVGSIAVGIDITEIKKAQEKVRESEKKFRDIFESANDAFIYGDLTGRILGVNRKAEELAGRKKEEILGKHFWKLGLVSLKDVPKLLGLLRRIIEGKPTTGLELTITRKDGEKRFIEVNSTVIRRNKVPTGFLAVVRDITERKRMEEQLKEYAEHLEEMVEERTRELREAQEQLLRSERLAAIGELAAMVGHDLRNPLQAITNAIHVINEIGKRMDVSGKFSFVPPPLQKELSETYTQLIEMVNIIDRSIAYANKIVSDLQDFARTKEPELTEVDLESLIQETLSGVSIPENVRVSIRHDQVLSKLRADPTQIRRVFTNLTTNAIQAMPDGGELTISTSLKDGFVSIAFQDTGVGIPKEDAEKLFTPLFTTKPKGVGLGLAICKNIVEAHGGSIEVESQEGRGSTFTVKLPVKRGGETSGEEGEHPDRG